MPFWSRSSGLVEASILEAQLLRTEAGAKRRKRRKIMFSNFELATDETIQEE